MRVLHMVPDIGVANGVVSVILNYFSAMPYDIKFDVVYFAEKSETRQKDIEEMGGRVFKIGAPSLKGLLKGNMKSFFNSHKGEWQAVHIHTPHFAVFMAPFAKKAGIKRICCHCHSTWYSLDSKNEKRNKLLAMPAKWLTDTRFACGLEAGRFWFKNNFYVLPNGIDCDKYAYSNNIKNEVKEELRIKNAFVAGHISRVYPPQKNHPFLFSVFSQIKKIHTDSVLLCIGAEKDEYLADLAAEYKIEKDVFFLGERKDVFKLLNAMDVFIFPSFKEGLPVSLIEAQANGLPALVSDSVTDECVINENVNMLSLNDSPEVWAEKALEIGGKRISGGADKLKKSGWDIYECAGRLADYYKTGIFKI